MSESEYEFTGKTVESAIEKGLKQLGLSHDEADIKILDEGKAGLFGLKGARSAKVKIMPRPLSADTTGSPQQEAESIIKNILSYTDINTHVETTLSDDEIIVNVKTEKPNILIGKQGQTLNALELLLNIIINKKRGDKIRIGLDVEGYRARRETFLVQLANNVAKEVIISNIPKDLPPMTSRERRIIHMTLKDNPQVQTHSEGEGRYRRVVISPAAKSPTSTSS